MKPIAGLNSDINPIDQPQNTMRYAANGTISETTGIAQNIRDELLWESFTGDQTFVGRSLGRTFIYMFFWANSADRGEIWRFSNNSSSSKELVIVDPGNFLELKEESSIGGEPNKYLQIVYHEDFEEHEVFAWAGQVRPKIIDIGKILDDAGWVTSDPPVNLSAEDYTRKDFLLFPEGSMFNPEAEVINSGGNISSGAWMFTYRYVYSDLSTTNFSGIGEVEYVTEDSLSKIGSFIGDVGNRNTSKSIKVTFPIDASQPDNVSIEIGYISIRGGVIFAGILSNKALSTLDDGLGNAEFIYTGENPEIDLGDNITELISKKAGFIHVATITALTGKLYVGNLTAKTEVDMQEMANSIVVNWQHTEQSVLDQNLNKATFGAGEVYALYISALYADGTESRGFHIPGRKFKAEVPGIAEVTATGSYLISGGPSAGGSVVGFQHGSFILSVSPTVGDTNAVAAAALVVFINGSAVPITATDGGAGLITLVADVTGSAGNLGMFELGNDPGFTYVLSGMTGGVDAVTAILADDAPIIDGLQKWQLYDTVDTLGSMGYWVNDGEHYPDTPEFNPSAYDILGTRLDNVRHHKLPSMGFMFENFPTLNALNLPSFDLIFSNINLDGFSNVVGYNIYYAKRKIGELINYTYEFPTPVGIRNADNNNDDLVPISGGYAYADNNGISEVDTLDAVVPSSKMMKFHGLSFLVDSPSVNPIYLVKELWHTRVLLTDFVLSNSQLYTDLLGRTNQIMVSAYKYGAMDESLTSNGGVVQVPPEADRYVLIDDFAYIKNGVNYTFDTGDSISNITGEDSFVVNRALGFDGGGFPLVYQFASVAGSEGLFGFGEFAETIMTFCALRTVPSNISTPFGAQVLTFVKSYLKEAGPVSVIAPADRGDAYNGQYQFSTTGVVGTGIDELSGVPADLPPPLRTVRTTSTPEAGMFNGEGAKMIYILSSQGIINHNAQMVDIGDVQSYIPKLQGAIGLSGIEGAFTQNGDFKLKSWWCSDQNIYASFTFFYNRDFHTRPEYFISGINDGFFVEQSRFPTTIRNSGQQFTDSQERKWREWLLLNKYVQPGEKGVIINLKGAGNQMLYIHHRYSLYTTKDRLTLQGGSTNVTLGSGDIFAVTPYELVSVSEGHTGIQNRHWQTLSPFGYTWIQNDHGKVYTHDGKSLQELSGQGKRIFFRDNISKGFSKKDDAFSVINDDLKRRIIIGFNYGINNSEDFATVPGPLSDQGYTIAYSTSGGFWEFYHSRNVVFPIVSRDKKVFSIVIPSDNIVRVLGVAQGSYNNLTRPFIIEAVLNDQKSDHKYLQYIRWNTNVWEANGSETTWYDEETETFNKIVIYSDTKIFGLPNLGEDNWLENLFPYIGFPRSTENVRRLEDNWIFNDFRDLSKQDIPILRNTVDDIGPNPAAVNTLLTWNEKARMRDKYLIVRLYYEKNNSKRIEVENIDFGIKPSFR